MPKFCASEATYQAYIKQELSLQSLPFPDSKAITLSFELTQKIAQKILEQGAMDFETFMQMALYEPALGYYAAGQQKFGAAGDFVTAPEISPLFAQTFAHQFAQVFKQTDANLLEFGAGSGIFAADCLLELERLGETINSYSILEVSAELQARQEATLKKLAPHLLDKVQWLTSLPKNFSGVIFANEVVDAIPCQLFRKNRASIERATVKVSDQGFQWQWQPQDLASQSLGLDIDLIHSWPNDYQFEVRRQGSAWLGAMLESLQQGVAFIVDYGFSQAELYSATRAQGGLQQYYRHHKTTNPLSLVGLQDITSSVNFTQLALAADLEQAQLLGYISQSMFLMGAGIEALAKNELAQQKMATTDASDTMLTNKIGQQLRQLLMPNEMGESCKVLAIGQQFQGVLSGFSLDNQLYKL
ncbi:class I SAM-dependent methyltransferase [Kangiella sp. TOML190]|uniref:class I SAM-dependent methyltransferase n=1 Tax=Kangiella sp. TOML190 TaxID=2931351 RepID=UPI0020400998|nr:SAM-dependent methyltransferase [Kangiella sp. TOML190]